MTTETEQTPATISKDIVSPEEGIESLKDQIARAQAESKARLGAADRAIQEQAARATKAEREVVEVKKGAVETTIESLTRDKEMAKRDFIAASETGDYKAAADAQDRISAANARIVAAEQGRVILEEELKAPPKPAQVQPQFVDQVEQVARQLAAPSAAWVRAHPEYITDPAKNEQMLRAHHGALAQGRREDTAAYFESINHALGIGGEHPRADVTPREGARTPSSAPVSREVSQTPRRESRGDVHLSAEEVEMALTLNLDPNKSRDEILRDYATTMANEIKAGRITTRTL